MLSDRSSGMRFGEFKIYTLLEAWPDAYNRNASPMIVTLVSFFHFTVYRHQALTPSVAFTSVRFLSFDMPK